MLASSQHPANSEDFGPDVQKSKEEGYLGYKIHPGQVQPKDGKAISRYVGHMEGIKLCRKTAGDDFILAHDPVQAYNLFRGAQSWPAAG
jgi:L-alanine-DL-glutamate epimerase-like enolase superfamily enzyme